MGQCCSARPKKEQPSSQSNVKAPQRTVQQQQRTWMATGIVSLRDVSSQGIPGSVLANMDRVRILDVSNNKFEELPASVDGMENLERLIAAANVIATIDCQLGQLRKLKALDLDNNQLSSIPDDIGGCVALETLRLRGNRLRSIPANIQACKRLCLLDVAENRLTCLPPPLGNCSGLETLDASQNLLVDIPGALSWLAKLRVLQLQGNTDLRGVPGQILTDCQLLHTLDLHDTLVTREVLQRTEGYEQFEARRQAKYSKAIDGNAMGRRNGMDEGVDVQLQ